MGIKDMRGERTSPPPTLFGINSPTPYATPPSCQYSEVTTGGGGASNPFHSKHQIHAGPQRRRNLFLFRVFSYNAYFHLASSFTTHIFIPRILLMRQFSFRAFSYDACFHYASSPTTLIFIPRILLWRLRNKDGAGRKCAFKKFLRNPKC